MAMRKIVVVGDKTTTSGMVLPNANSTFSVGDAAHKVALIGGQATCLACKGLGIIAKAGGPRRMNFMGEVALEDDIVICGCPVPPKLVSNLHQTMTYDDQAESMGTIVSPVGAGAATAAALAAGVQNGQEKHGKLFLFEDSETGKPLANRKFLVNVGGAKQNGITDGNGYAHVDAAPGQEVQVHLIFEAPIGALMHGES
jgi:hypothetical protein